MSSDDDTDEVREKEEREGGKRHIRITLETRSRRVCVAEHEAEMSNVRARVFANRCNVATRYAWLSASGLKESKKFPLERWSIEIESKLKNAKSFGPRSLYGELLDQE